MVREGRAAGRLKLSAPGMVGTPILAEQHDEWQNSDRRYLTMNNVTTLDLDQPIMLELEAAQH